MASNTSEPLLLRLGHSGASSSNRNTFISEIFFATETQLRKPIH